MHFVDITPINTTEIYSSYFSDTDFVPMKHYMGKGVLGDTADGLDDLNPATCFVVRPDDLQVQVGVFKGL